MRDPPTMNGIKNGCKRDTNYQNKAVESLYSMEVKKILVKELAGR